MRYCIICYFYNFIYFDVCITAQKYNKNAYLAWVSCRFVG